MFQWRRFQPMGNTKSVPSNSHFEGDGCAESSLSDETPMVCPPLGGGMPRRGRGEYSAQSENRRYEVLPSPLRGAPFGGRAPPRRFAAPPSGDGFARPRGLAHPAARPAPPAPPRHRRAARRATCRASTRRKNGLSDEPGGATMPPIHTEAPAWAGYVAGVALASCCRDV